MVLQRVFGKYNKNITGSNVPAIQGCNDAVKTLCCSEKWIMEDKLVEEVIATTNYAT